MRFPGARYLHGWDLTHHSVSLDALLRSCQQVGLTGYAELKTAAGVGMSLLPERTKSSVCSSVARLWSCRLTAPGER